MGILVGSPCALLTIGAPGAILKCASRTVDRLRIVSLAVHADLAVRNSGAANYRRAIWLLLLLLLLLLLRILVRAVESGGDGLA
jgi:hypothetical protein